MLSLNHEMEQGQHGKATLLSKQTMKENSRLPLYLRPSCHPTSTQEAARTPSPLSQLKYLLRHTSNVYHIGWALIIHSSLEVHSTSWAPENAMEMLLLSAFFGGFAQLKRSVSSKAEPAARD